MEVEWYRVCIQPRSWPELWIKPVKPFALRVYIKSATLDSLQRCLTQVEQSVDRPGTKQVVDRYAQYNVRQEKKNNNPPPPTENAVPAISKDSSLLLFKRDGGRTTLNMQPERHNRRKSISALEKPRKNKDLRPTNFHQSFPSTLSLTHFAKKGSLQMHITLFRFLLGKKFSGKVFFSLLCVDLSQRIPWASGWNGMKCGWKKGI